MNRPRDLQKALLADLEQIEDNSQLYRVGRESAYQSVAIQLRNLLLKGRRGLLGRVIPQLMLHQLRPSNIPTETLEAFHRDPSKVKIMDVRGHVKGGGKMCHRGGEIVYHQREPEDEDFRTG